MDGTSRATAPQRPARQRKPLARQELVQRQPGQRQPGQQKPGQGIREQLGALFPVAPEPPARPSAKGRRVAGIAFADIAIAVAALCAGAAALLLRVGGVPAWDSIYAEDNGVFLVGALAHPWHLFTPYAGYEELGPRLIGQLVASLLPLADAAKGYAVAGALVGSASGLFMYYASDGYIRSRWLRAMLAAALVLLPLAPLDIADSGVDSPWYPLTALFFAALWRPKGWPGMLAAALIACYATSSEIVAAIYAPVLLARVIALPRWREHAVTIGWLVGLLAQVPVVAATYLHHTQRVARLSRPGQALAFYFHNVVLRALGWKVSLHLKEIAGYNGATVIVAVILAIGIGLAMVVGGRQARLFAVLALILGFAQAFLTAMITSYVNDQSPTATFLPAARYSTMPIVVIDAILILGADAIVSRHGPATIRLQRWGLRSKAGRARGLLAVAALVCVLAVGWVADFRYATTRTTSGYWQPVAQRWLHECDHASTGTIRIPAWNSSRATVACSRLNR